MIRKTWLSLFILAGILLSASCHPAPSGPTAPAQANMPNPASVYCEQQGHRSEIVTAADGSQSGVCIFPDDSVCDEWAYFRGECDPAKQGALPSPSPESPAAMGELDSQPASSVAPSAQATLTLPAPVVTNEPFDYCFAYPQGFTQLIYNSQVEVVGPQAGLGDSGAGLVWIEVKDAEGRTALEMAEEEVIAFGGAPLRSSVMIGGEEALVLDGMPGQDAIRKVYLVHHGGLYTLNFSPYQPDNDTANAQMESLFASVTSSWVWMSSGEPCPVLAVPPLSSPSIKTPAPTGLPNSQPGVLITGFVQLANGEGLAGVKIYRAFAAYPGQLIATTTEDGCYQSEFAPIPGDEMVRVWAELPGYRLEPVQTFWTDPNSTESNTVYWRHYFGYEEVTLNFRAVEAP